MKSCFSALAFKLMSDPYVGQLTFIRVYSGVLRKGDAVYNPGEGQERAYRTHRADGMPTIATRWTSCAPGDIAACGV